MVSEKRSVGFLQNSTKVCKAKSSKKALEYCLICGSIRGRIAFIPTKSTLVGTTSTLLCDFINEILNETARVSEFVCQTCYVTLEHLDIQRKNVQKIQACIIGKYQKTKAESLKSQNIIPDLIYNSLLNVDKIETGTTLNICDQLSVTVYHKKDDPNISAGDVTKFQMPCDISITKGTNKRKFPIEKQVSSKKRACIDDAASDASKLLKRKVLPVENAGPKLEMGLTSSVLSEGLELLASSSQEFPSYSNPSKESVTLEKVSHEKSVPAENKTSVEESNTKSSSACSDSSSSDSISSSEFSDNSEQLEKSADALPSQNGQDNDVAVTECESSSSSEAIPLNSEIAQAVFMQSSLDQAADLINSFMSSSLWLGPTDNSEDSKHTINETKQDKLKRLELKNTGQSYINTKGKVINAKKISYQDCSRCPLRCNENLSEAAREDVFADYWGIGNYELQKEYLASHMTRGEKTAMTGSCRTIINYYLTYNGEKVPVCRQFFLKTLDVSEKLTRCVLNRKQKLQENHVENNIKAEPVTE